MRTRASGATNKITKLRGLAGYKAAPVSSFADNHAGQVYTRWVSSLTAYREYVTTPYFCPASRLRHALAAVHSARVHSGHASQHAA